MSNRNDPSFLKGDISDLPEDIDAFIDHFLSVMCDRSRRQILELLTIPSIEGQALVERRSGDIARELGLSPATVSGHLRQLAEAGLIHARKEGNMVYYRVSNRALVQAFQDLVLALNKEHQERASNAGA